MKDFMFLFRGGEPAARLSPEEMQRNMQTWGAWIQELARAGKFTSGHPLEHGGKVVSGRSRLVTDRPFTESKEVVGGYLIVSGEGHPGSRRAVESADGAEPGPREGRLPNADSRP